MSFGFDSSNRNMTEIMKYNSLSKQKKKLIRFEQTRTLNLFSFSIVLVPSLSCFLLVVAVTEEFGN